MPVRIWSLIAWVAGLGFVVALFNISRVGGSLPWEAGILSFILISVFAAWVGESSEAKFYAEAMRLLLGKARLITRPPGSFLHSMAKFFCTKKTYERVVKPAIADMRHEYCEALAERATLRAVWIRVRGILSILFALGVYKATKIVWDVWRSVR